MKVIRVLLGLLLAVPLAIAAEPITLDTGPVLVITRHAEKLSGDDPCLSASGQARANTLARMLAGNPIKSIFSTDYCRTRETLEPLAEQAGVGIEKYEPLDAAAIRSALQRKGNGMVVVAGHSNTVPALLKQLGAEVPEIREDEYGNLYVVSFNKEVSEVRGLLHLNY